MYEKIAVLLEKNNKTAYRVAKETGIPEVAFSNWKHGRNQPSLNALIKLSKYFDVPLDYFAK